MANSGHEDVRDFYDDFAGEYHLLFANWRQEVLRQGEILDRLIRAEFGSSTDSVLDCTCGIGTQAIGLATRGYRVHATDLSAPAVTRAQREAQSFGVAITGQVADVRKLDAVVKDRFSVVIACDNSLSHMVEDADLFEAARQIHGRLQPNGLFLASIRDYDRVLDDALTRPPSGAQQLPGEYSNRPGLPNATLPRVFDGGNRIVFQVWDWADDHRSYAIHQFVLRRVDGDWTTVQHTGRFRALRQRELTVALEAAGFRHIAWRPPHETGFYQPIVTAIHSQSLAP
jgi:glycine/sarcosine N-methyltransferase